jgi:hypothetical protein
MENVEKRLRSKCRGVSDLSNIRRIMFFANEQHAANK